MSLWWSAPAGATSAGLILILATSPSSGARRPFPPPSSSPTWTPAPTTWAWKASWWPRTSRSSSSEAVAQRSTRPLAERGASRRIRGFLAAAARLARGVGGLEAVTAGAALDGVGVEDGESALHEVVHVIDLRALQQGGALRVHQQLHTLLLNDDVSLLHLAGQGHAVLVSGATTAHHEDPQGSLSDAALGQDPLGLRRRLLGDGQHCAPCSSPDRLDCGQRL